MKENIFIVSFKARRKNAKRHIASKFNSYEKAKDYALGWDKKKYYVEICNTKWEVLEVVNESK